MKIRKKMLNITIPEKNFITSGGSSRGYAKKAFVSGKWYKVSAGAFNAQAEGVASRIAEHTNVGDCVSYEMCIINGEYGTVSVDFICGRRYETLKSLHAKTTGSPIESVTQYLAGADLLKYTRSFIKSELKYDMLLKLSIRGDGG